MSMYQEPTSEDQIINIKLVNKKSLLMIVELTECDSQSFSNSQTNKYK